MDNGSSRVVTYATLARKLQYIAGSLRDFAAHLDFEAERLLEIDKRMLPLHVNSELKDQVHGAMQLAHAIPRAMALPLVASLIGINEELETARVVSRYAFERDEHDIVLADISRCWARASTHATVIDSTALLLLAELDLDNEPTMKTWQPSPGFVRRADVNILAKQLGKRAVPDATLAGSRATDDPAVEIDPSTRELCYEEAWIRTRLNDYQPGRNARKRDDATNREPERD